MQSQLIGIALAAALALGTAHAGQPVFAARPTNAVAAQPPVPPTALYPVQGVLDDNTDEGTFGVTQGQSAQQFMWFNRFTLPQPHFQLQQIWVLFPASANIAVGAPIQIAVYTDADGDPTNGATLISTFDTTVQFADDLNFSVYNLPAPLDLHSPGDVLVGVIPRFITSGTTPPTNPATVDTTASQGRSWVAVWSGDPPNPPTLPPDALITTLDSGLVPGGGNWMIRVFGVVPTVPVSATPALAPWGLFGAGALLALGGSLRLRRRTARVRNG